MAGCKTTIETKTIYVPVLPPLPSVENPGLPEFNGNEDDELLIIAIQVQTIESLLLWADHVIETLEELRAAADG